MSHWKEEDDKLKASFQFDNFVKAFTFMNEVAFHIEKDNHHPWWSNVYNTVTIELTTHDAGNKVTEKDHNLAKKISAVFDKK